MYDILCAPSFNRHLELNRLKMELEMKCFPCQQIECVRTNDVWIRHPLEFIATLKQISTSNQQQMNNKMGHRIDA